MLRSPAVPKPKFRRIEHFPANRKAVRVEKMRQSKPVERPCDQFGRRALYCSLSCTRTRSLHSENRPVACGGARRSASCWTASPTGPGGRCAARNGGRARLALPREVLHQSRAPRLCKAGSPDATREHVPRSATPAAVRHLTTPGGVLVSGVLAARSPSGAAGTTSGEARESAHRELDPRYACGVVQHCRPHSGGNLILEPRAWTPMRRPLRTRRGAASSSVDPTSQSTNRRKCPPAGTAADRTSSFQLELSLGALS